MADPVLAFHREWRETDSQLGTDSHVRNVPSLIIKCTCILVRCSMVLVPTWSTVVTHLFGFGYIVQRVHWCTNIGWMLYGLLPTWCAVSVVDE